jgi:putative tryptophan/tyrosine transport system substrate-binding protein
MRRRTFIAGLAAAAIGTPIGANAQQSERARRIGVLSPYGEDNPYANARLSAFVRRLSDLGWNEGRNLRIEVRWAAGNIDRVPVYAKELVSLQPDVLFADSTPQTAALQRETLTIPIVFVVVSDPIGSGFVASLSRPGGNITGFVPWEPTMGGKWVELLTEIAPGLHRIAALFNPDTAPYVTTNYLPSFQAAVRSLGLEPIVAAVHDDAEIENIMNSLARESRGGLVVMPDAFSLNHRASIISLAARNKVPVVYQESAFPKDGGLLAYGAEPTDIYHRAASYVDRILRGAKPADLPVQLPVKFEVIVNLKTAKALGLTVPPSILIRADEVIE